MGEESGGGGEVIAKLEGLGLKLLDCDAIHPEETELEFVLAAQGARGMAFLRALDCHWLDPDVAEEIINDFGDVPGRTCLYIDGGQGGTYVWLPEENIAEFCELFPEAVRG